MENSSLNIPIENVDSEAIDKATEPSTNNTQHADEAPKRQDHRTRRMLVVVGAVLTVLGWLTLMLNEWLSLALTAAGLVVSILGVRIPPGPRRDVAITAIIAASVLLLVIVGIEIAIGIIS